jgi:hypothetical protein
MKTCPYCGKQYPDDAQICAVDQQPLEARAESQEPALAQGICPQCGTPDDFTHVVDPHRSFNWLTFLLGGLIAVIFQNAGRPQRVRCNKCDARFHVRSKLSLLWRIIFWLLIAPAIITLAIALVEFLMNSFCH